MKTDDNKPLFTIRIVAEELNVHPQTLRTYEQKGLIHPFRSAGNTRFYSLSDMARIARIIELSEEGVSLLGIEKILELEEENAVLQADNVRLKNKVNSLIIMLQNEQLKQKEQRQDEQTFELAIRPRIAIIKKS